MAILFCGVGQEVLGVDYQRAYDHQDDRQAEAEGDEKQESEAYPTERDGAEEENQCRLAGDESAAHCERGQTTPGDLVRDVVTMDVAAGSVGVDEFPMLVGVLVGVGVIVGVRMLVIVGMRVLVIVGVRMRMRVVIV